MIQRRGDRYLSWRGGSSTKGVRGSKQVWLVCSLKEIFRWGAFEGVALFERVSSEWIYGNGQHSERSGIYVWTLIIFRLWKELICTFINVCPKREFQQTGTYNKHFHLIKTPQFCIFNVGAFSLRFAISAGCYYQQPQLVEQRITLILENKFKNLKKMQEGSDLWKGQIWRGPLSGKGLLEAP